MSFADLHCAIINKSSFIQLSQWSLRVRKTEKSYLLHKKKKLSLRIFYFSSELINDITYNLQWNNEAIIVTTYVLTR